MLTDCNIEVYRASLQEVVAAPGHANAAIAFGLALATAATAPSPDAGLLWVREAAVVAEMGDPYGPGLMDLGVRADNLIVVAARTKVEALRAALEGARCTALSAVILETRAGIDLTSSRRLKLASEKSGVAVVLVRASSEIVANATQTRWLVRGMRQAECENLRACTAFQAEVLKHRAGLAGKTCIMEWDHERRRFDEALSQSLAAVSNVGPLAA